MNSGIKTTPQISSNQSNRAIRTNIEVIDDRFIIRRVISKFRDFYFYEGVDLKASKFVNIYINHRHIDFCFSKKIKESIRLKFSPSVIWNGPLKMQGQTFEVQIHQKCGPSLKSMFQYLKKPISEKDFLLLLFELIKLVQKYSSEGYVHRQLSMDNITFSKSPADNTLYLLNIFPLRKKGEKQKLINTKFCSKGAHLGLSKTYDIKDSCIKDDLESICYILMHIHSDGECIKGEDYKQIKSSISLKTFKRQIPSLFTAFYSCVFNLNHGEELDFYKWKCEIVKQIGRDAACKPYSWMMSNDSNCSINKIEGFQAEQQQEQQQSNDSFQIDPSEIEDELKPQDKHFTEKVRKDELKDNKKR